MTNSGWSSAGLPTKPMTGQASAARCETKAEPDRHDADKHAAKNVQQRGPEISAAQQGDRFQTEGGEGGETAQHTRDQEQPHGLRRRRAREHARQNADEQAADTVDREGAPRKPLALA